MYGVLTDCDDGHEENLNAGPDQRCEEFREPRGPEHIAVNQLPAGLLNSLVLN